MSNAYATTVGGMLQINLVILVAYGGLLGLTVWLFGFYPVGFIPQQDQGWLLVDAQLPDSASVQRTGEVIAQMAKIASTIDGVDHTLTISGQSVLLQTNSSNFGSLFVILKPFEERRTPDHSAQAIQLQLRRKYTQLVREARVGVYGAPPVPGIGLAAGFKMMIEDRGSLGPVVLQKAADDLVESSGKKPHMIVMPTVFRSNSPQLFMEIDRTKAKSLGVAIDDLNRTLQIFLGSYYVNNFNEFGRSWQVNIQADDSFRNRVEDLNQLFVRNLMGEMVPLGSLIRMKDVGGPVMITRYNL